MQGANKDNFVFSELNINMNTVWAVELLHNYV